MVTSLKQHSVHSDKPLRKLALPAEPSIHSCVSITVMWPWTCLAKFSFNNYKIAVFHFCHLLHVLMCTRVSHRAGSSLHVCNSFLTPAAPLLKMPTHSPQEPLHSCHSDIRNMGEPMSKDPFRQRTCTACVSSFIIFRRVNAYITTGCISKWIPFTAA